jgi:hypothetical protein
MEEKTEGKRNEHNEKFQNLYSSPNIIKMIEEEGSMDRAWSKHIKS